MSNALGRPKRAGGHVCDHLGNNYPSVTEMCRHYGIHATTYCKRISRGWSVERALSPSSHNKTVLTKCIALPRRNGCYVDHLGNVFSSLRSMCLCWHIGLATFRSILEYGHNLKDSLTFRNETKFPDVDNNVVWVDGVPYPTHAAVDLALGLAHSRSSRQGDTLGDWLANGDEHIINGVSYTTLEAVAKEYKLTSSCLISRMKRLDMSLEDATHVPLRRRGNHGKSCADHLGNEYSSYVEMALAWDISYAALMNRLHYKWSLEDALTTPVQKTFMGRQKN